MNEEKQTNFLTRRGKSLLIWLTLVLLSYSSFGKDRAFVLKSPDSSIVLEVNVTEKQLTWSIYKHQELLLSPSSIDLVVNGKHLGRQAKLQNAKIEKIQESIDVEVPTKTRQINDQYELLTLYFDQYRVQFRAYNDGVAYRFLTDFASPISVDSEPIDFRFPSNYRVFWSKEENKQFLSHFESLYTDSMINDFSSDQHAALPLLLQSPRGTNMLLSETDLRDYPNLFLFASGQPILTSRHPKYITKSDRKGDRGFMIKEEANYIAETSGNRSFPWRTVAIASADKDLLSSTLNYKLAAASALKNTKWIKPGKVAWDWWNANNVFGVDFKAGINTETYKYYIDFASQLGLEYIMLDEGWTRTTTDLKHANEAIDIQEIIRYGESKNVGVWLWCLWEPLDLDLEGILDQYARWGAKGIKVDFMARADQYMVNYYERVAKACADRQLMVNFHGAFKPVGLHRTYPNVMNYEGVRGLENNKWENTITPKHNLTLPFTRMVAGPMDYTPGAMKNVTAANFHPAYDAPMSMGTRTHQAAMYVLYESPLQMLADSPSAYLQDPIYTNFIAQIPTVWEETIPLEGKIGEYIAIARRYQNKWYVSAMSDWKGKKMTLNLPFRSATSVEVQVLCDGVNSDRHPADYKIETQSWDGVSPLDITIMPGGGWVGIFEEIK